MDEINKLIKKIEDKDIENSKFEIEQNELQEDVRQRNLLARKLKYLQDGQKKKKSMGQNCRRILKHYINKGNN